MTNYPEKIKKINVKKNYKTLKEAKTDGARNIKKWDRGYVGYIDFEIDNIKLTGRKMYVIDEDGKTHFERLEIINSHPFDGTSKLIGFEGIFICKSTMDIDLYVSLIVYDMPLIKKFIENLTKKEIEKNLYIEEKTKAGKTILDSFLASKGLNIENIKTGKY